MAGAEEPDDAEEIGDGGGAAAKVGLSPRAGRRPSHRARVRERRIALGLTQQQLAERVGTTYQQAHKYETGLNRIAAGRRHALEQTAR